MWKMKTVFPAMPMPYLDHDEEMADQVNIINGKYLGNFDVQETPNDYMARTMHDVQESKKKGIPLRNTLLKSDVIFKNVKDSIHPDSVTEEEPSMYDEFNPKFSFRYASLASSRVLTKSWRDGSADTLRISDSAVGVFRVDPADFKFEEVAFNTSLLRMDFDPTKLCTISRGKLKVPSGECYDLRNLSMEDVDDMVARRIAIRYNQNSIIFSMQKGFVKVQF